MPRVLQAHAHGPQVLEAQDLEAHAPGPWVLEAHAPGLPGPRWLPWARCYKQKKKNSEDNEIQKELEKKSEEFKEAGGNIYVKQS